MTKTTSIIISDEQIEALEQAAAMGGDNEQVRLCRLVLSGERGSKAARKACEQAIRNGQG